MKKLVLIIFLTFAANLLLASNVLFEQANKYYSKEKYQDAILLYDSIQKNGLQSIELFYNMGNTYYKIQDWPNCILYYEKTLTLDVNHEDALHNLELAQLKIVDKIETIPVLFFEKWIDNLVVLLPFDSWGIFSLILLWAVFIIFCLITFSNIKLSKLPITSLIILSIFAFVFANKQFNQKTKKRNAIIFSSSVVIKSAPSFSANDLFSLHSGSKIAIIDQIGNWIHIRLLDGNKGWILKEHCKEI